MKPAKAALTGLIALVTALAAGHLVAAFVGLSASPYLAVGNAAIDLTPSWLKDFAVTTFGTADKLVLLICMGVVLVGIGIGAGLASRNGPAPGTLVAVLLGFVGVAAVVTRPDVGQLAVLAPVASTAAGVYAFRYLHREAEENESRRGFLITAGLAVFAGVAGQLFGSRTDVEGSRQAVGDLTPKVRAPEIPLNADFVKDGTPSFITSSKDFYRIDTALSVPRLRAEEWALRVHGMVERPMVLTFEEIRSRDLVEETVTLTCVSNEVGGPYISTANFVGVRIGDVLREAGVKAGADQLFSTSDDGFTAGSPLDYVLETGLIAIGMNGEPLPAEHGFPARLVVPGLYGYVSATKWVTDLNVTTFAKDQGYWIPRGWATRAPIKVSSRIDRPTRMGRVQGRVVVAGTAWAQPKGVARVEVRVDGGPWQEAELGADVSDTTWRMWRVELDLGRGSHAVECRATDKSGFTQDQARLDPVPDGATGWHSVTFTVD
ncbi:DMSO/TMAO reductase YedYZ, molybdopterin-dependent catalytic subunit [Lentzea albidocapillata subsp. violacea]|uniref:DMSO/TMAO reductase YedYZ, molybdopterin-dependent catalytic subunit n=1 Tax=Lentzea albidocapillata subsp. violacea TaxID=128104 RepID=A0A1G9LCM7_9PSEU|nr:molybdopterin-dependent oxidoreductase [Lentzea albidocapillata]SDL59487.1 DMSO/TMAO reductase YedYZ, molybdopterin-dependent catalytic subunit [Lentzea albidocapillata subsp. violacea]